MGVGSKINSKFIFKASNLYVFDINKYAFDINKYAFDINKNVFDINTCKR